MRPEGLTEGYFCNTCGKPCSMMGHQSCAPDPVLVAQLKKLNGNRDDGVPNSRGIMTAPDELPVHQRQRTPKIPEPQKIFLLVSFGGSYEDAWENVIVASFDKGKLEAKVAEKTAELNELRADQAEFSAFCKDWEKKNPRPVIPDVVYDHIPVPLLPNREKDITLEMRAEKERIKAENSRRRELASNAAYAEYHVWNKRYTEAKLEFITSKGWTEEYVGHYCDDRGYRIDETELV